MIDFNLAARRPLAAIALAGLPFGLMVASTPAFAQEEGSETVRFVTVVGEEECPRSTADEIIVCAKYDGNDQFRLPTELRGNPDAPENQSWAQRAKTLDDLGEQGALSCSTSGLGGYTGCTQEMIEAYYAQKDAASTGRASEIINAQREERLSGVDAEAEAEEARVQEAIRRQEEMRRQREQGTYSLSPVDTGEAADADDAAD